MTTVMTNCRQSSQLSIDTPYSIAILSSMSLEDTLRAWAQPPSETEQTKAENAERVIRDALNADTVLSSHNFRVFAQGSYKARTNVRLNSDVDICVVCEDVHFYDLQFSDLTAAELPGTSPSLTFWQFRQLVEQALVARFGRAAVTRGKKAFDVHANTYRLDADVVAAFEFRRYNKRGPRGEATWTDGIAFVPDAGARIENWPRQTYENGVAKNTRTSRCYKSVIRIMKRLRDAMQEDNIVAASNVGSFAIESLIWNVPDPDFGGDTYAGVLRRALAHTFNNTLSDEACSDWGEVNELKYLFRGTSDLRPRLNAFLGAAWDYVSFD